MSHKKRNKKISSKQENVVYTYSVQLFILTDLYITTLSAFLVKTFWYFNTSAFNLFCNCMNVTENVIAM